MSQDDINEAEWNNPDNWSSGLYFSKKDSRVWVPKQMRTGGWTINLGHTKGAAWMTGIVLGIILITVLGNVVTIYFVSKK